VTAVLHDLRQSLTLTREVYGRGSSQSQAAFELLVRTAAQNGTPIDALRNYVEDEVERFFSYTIPGPDGHVYWDGPKGFRRNDNKYRTPLRWWWQHHYGNLSNNDDLVLKCGEKNCINPEHAAKEYLRGFRFRWTQERMIGRLQVVALQKGHTPTTTEWEREHHHPVGEMYVRMFGGWAQAVAAAGLAPTRGPGKPSGEAEVIAGIRLARKVLGAWPTEHNYRLCRKELIEAGLPSTVAPARRLYGSFLEARVAAGGPTRTVGGGDWGVGQAQPTRADCLAAIRFLRDRVGRWPTITHLRAEHAALREAGLPSSGSAFERIFGTFVKARKAAIREETREDAQATEGQGS
jgi:hypothetical protein